ncbi:isoleucyl-tRNA synthetase [Pedobacter antarcticus]|uniref:isoleucyl-tRNA synthetase n=1 Tax=Pedobacter antarcticus TaxID=34086 RepID=UPI00292E0E02|nr:isoleucyl-tRNA synthetase [Pedobacter antarcticus]
MKLQKAVIAILLAAVALVVYLMSDEDNSWSKYLLELSGFLFMLGGFLFLYPILFSRKDKEGCVELDPEAPVQTEENRNSQE